MERLRAKALGNGELPESEHGLAAAPGVVSAVAVSLRRMAMSLGALQTIADPEEGPNAMEDSSVKDLLGQGPGMVMESEMGSEQRVQVLERAWRRWHRNVCCGCSGVFCGPRRMSSW